jgi:hypothetical protein
MLTKRPERVKPNPKTRAKARRAFREAAKALTSNDAQTVFDSRGRPRKNRYFVKA